MPDWKMLVRERMSEEDATPAPHDEVVAELAGHLEDRYEVLRAQGVCESEAIAHAISEIGDSRQLAGRIRRAKRPGGTMNDRTKQLWLPGLASLTVGNVLLMIFTRISLDSRLVAERSTALFPGLALMEDYMPWLAAQPLIGALGAWLSYRARGGRAMRLCAGLFPSMVMLACWGLLIPATAAIERHAWAARHPVYLLLGTLVWVAPAMMGLLLGSLPFLGIRDFRGPGATSPCPTRT